MTKKKGAGKLPPDPASSPSVEAEVDYANPRTSEEDGNLAATATATNTEREDPVPPRADQESSPPSSSTSSVVVDLLVVE